MEWQFSDGTVVRLGGVVEGDSPFAVELRGQLELLPYGKAAHVSIDPQPMPDETLDPSDPLHVEAWTNDWMRFFDDVSLVSGPTLVPRPIEPTGPDELDRIY